MEAVHRRANDLPVRPDERREQFVSKRRLTGSINTVDGDSGGMVAANGADRGGDLLEAVGTGHARQSRRHRRKTTGGSTKNALQ